MSQQSRCTNPRIGVLIEQFIDGELTKRGRAKEREAFVKHAPSCPTCWNVLVDYSGAMVFQILSATAKRRGVPLDDVMDEFVQNAEKMMAAGKLRELGEILGREKTEAQSKGRRRPP